MVHRRSLSVWRELLHIIAEQPFCHKVGCILYGSVDISIVLKYLDEIVSVVGMLHAV